MKKMLLFLALLTLVAGCGHPVTIGLIAWLSQGDDDDDGAIMPAKLSVAATTLPYAVNGVAYNAELRATGGKAPYNWSVVGGGTPPTGITLDAGTGVLSGTPGAAASDYTFTVEVVDSKLDSASRQFTVTLYDELDFTFTPPLPDATLNTPYGPVAITAAGGTGNYTWSMASGALPSGMTFNTATGEVGGTPNDATGTYAFSVTVSDDAVPAQTAGPLNLTLDLYDVLTITTPTPLPYAINGVAYSQTLSAGGGSAPYSNWTIVSGTQPSLLTLNASTGELSGMPGDAAGDFTFTVEVTDSAVDTATKQFTMTLYDELQITYAGPLPDGINGQSYGPETVTATGGTGNITWSLSAGTLPSGVTLTTDSGDIQGLPTETGAFPITVMVQDDASPPQSDTIDLTLNVYGVLTITTTTLPYAINGVAYSEVLNATGGTGTYSWSESGGPALPTGLSITAGGLVDGTPGATTGFYNFTAQVDDDGSPSQSDTQDLSIQVYNVLSITTAATLPSASVDVPYSQALSATGGDGTYTWTNPTADLPAWLSLNSGVLSGTPISGDIGDYSFTLEVTDGETPPQTDQLVFSVSVVDYLTWEDTFDDETKIDAAAAASFDYTVRGGYVQLSMNVGAAAVDASYTPANTNPIDDFGGTTWVAQTFTVTATGRISEAALYHDRNGAGNVIYEIRDVVAGQPGSQIYASVSFGPPGGGWGWHWGTFPTPFDVYPGEVYALVCHATGAAGSQRATSDPDAYAGGAAFESADSGSTWSILNGADRDIGFAIRVQPLTSYNSPGGVESITISPATVSEWGELSFTTDEPTNTAIVVRVLYDSGGGTWVPIPDVDLAGNTSTGFAIGDVPVDLSGLIVGTYSALRLRAELSTTDTSVTPKLFDWQVTYRP